MNIEISTVNVSANGYLNMIDEEIYSDSPTSQTCHEAF